MSDDVKVINAPERIYLNLGEIDGIGDVPFKALSDVTWCEHCLDDTDIEYVRADLAALASSNESEAVTDAARDVLAERERQMTAEGWTLDHDDEHTSGEMAKAAAAYALNAGNVALGWPKDPLRAVCEPPPFWPWDRDWWKPDTLRWMLVKAGALILAEIERIDRALARTQADGGGS
jgi:hypothetical protein